MIEEPQVVRSEEQLTAVIRLRVPRDQIREVMEPGISEVRAVVAAQGIDLTGPWFTHHFRMDSAVFDFEVGVPVATAVAPSGRVVPGHLPATTVARTVYHGPYEGLGEAWGEFDAWLEAHGHRADVGLWECYATGPESEADPASWRTELNRPLLD